MKLQLTILAVMVTIFTFSQDTSHQTSYRKNTIAALKAQEPVEVKPQPITISNDTTKGWRKFTVVPVKEKNWWGYTKDFITAMWNDKPWILVLGGIFLLMGIWKLFKKIIE
ncbi:MAG: hypothetical protein ABIX01_12315 [Chitinophagaceae bacterium]